MSEPLMSVAGQLIGIPAEKYSGTNGVTVDQNNKTIGLDETVLYDGGTGYQPGTGTAPTNVNIQLSEAITNFDYLRIYLGGKLSGVIEFMPGTATTTESAANHKVYRTAPDNTNNDTIVGVLITIVANDATQLNFRCGYSSSWASAYRSGEDWGYYILYKIVGVNRISGGNA